MQVMQLLAIVSALAILTPCIEASLLDTLKAIHNSPAFHNLNSSEQLIIVELFAEVEAGELKAYIDSVGFHTVLSVIDHLPQNEAHRVTTLLIQELNKEGYVMSTTTPASAVGKRDLVSVLKNLQTNSAYQALPAEDQQFVQELLKAASTNTVTQLVQQVGYARVLDLVDALPQHEGHMLSNYIIQHMNTESAGSR